MIKLPPYLKQGDTIGLVCPAGYMPVSKVQTCMDTLESWGYKVKTGATIGGDSENYFSGTPAQRLKDFQQMLDSDEVKAILCARGGYGTSHIIDKIRFKKFVEQPKWIIGFSDITVLHCHIYSKFYISSMHAPMAGAFNDGGAENEYVLSLKKLLEGKKGRYKCEMSDYNRKGEAIGELVGGNLALITHLIGTESDLKTKGRILFIEDTGEFLYNIDRMMQQLKRSGKLSKLAGLVVGGFTENKDTDRPYGADAYEIIYNAVKDYDYPTAFGFPVGHSEDNYALKVGAGYKLKVGKSRVTLEE